MTTPTPHGCMLLFRGMEWTKALSPEEAQKVMGQWMAWFDELIKDGRATSGSPLEAAGKVVSGAGGKVIVDGPYAESKEAVGGYFYLTVKTFEEAMSIAQACPGLPHGAVVEVRPIAGECALAEQF
ncbi:MAG: YCII-related domain protein [Verrucomicrobiaceae bacterium]|nr:YCII-related domain protein [Verrucomicrobiaceae bacterium]